MRSKSLIILLALMLLSVGFFVVFAQAPDDEVRGAFLSSRPKTSSANGPSHRHRSRPSNSNNTAANANSSYASANVNAGAKVQFQAIGLGYTLFMRDPRGRGVRVEPGREFHNGDSVRISLEPNVDGYIYVFHTENDGGPEMIYPDARLDGGDNSIEAHVPLEVPSSEETDDRLRWFTFYGNGGTEHLFVVLTREPLRSVPTGNDLVAWCAANKDKCPWHPPQDVWISVMKDAARSNIKVVTAKTFGQTQTETEKTATTRGLGLDKSAPQPSVIRMNASTNEPMLVTLLDLTHK
jgi:Domain of unknown function (DUF4384)